MKDQLAEQLLAKVMGWKNPADFVEHGRSLMAMAAYKYDEYQQFSPGMRFIESLALWLGQFKTQAQRKAALSFVRERLVFVSAAEMNHLVSISYPDHIRPFLLSKAAAESGLSKWHMARVANSVEFSVRERRCLFLGLSDGSHTDVFRRANSHLQNEQVRQSHELTGERSADLHKELIKDLTKLLGREPTDEEDVFRSVVLLDDFSASGMSYVRKAEDGSPGGKVGKFLASLHHSSAPLSGLFTAKSLEVILVLYMATETAESVLLRGLSELCEPYGHEAKVVIVQKFPESQRVTRGTLPEFDTLIDAHYDKANETSSTALGGTDLKYGFAAGALPLILSHNTPNNSVGLLWAEGPNMKPLFPRITRHKDL
ncbi:MAG: hypothetical protein LAP21_21405 [Acidobacteriia bacterium]|nr:hypothetical protein [Terriglobia bacterium]